MQEIMLNQFPWIPIMQPEEGYGIRNGVTWQPNSTSRADLRRESLTWAR